MNLKTLTKSLALVFLIATGVLADFSGNEEYQYERPSNEYANYQIGVRYDEYPVVVPKRAALLLDRLMVALKQAMEEEQNGLKFDDRSGKTSPKPRSLPISPEDMMGMQRRGHSTLAGQPKGRIYWRCYFNAVTCFKRKRQN